MPVKVGCVFMTPWMQVRHRGKINIKNPRPGPWERRIMEAITVPIVLRDLEMLKTPSQVCAEWRQKRLPTKTEPNPWEEFMVRRCKEMFEQHKLVAVFQALPSKAEEKKATNNKLLKKGLRLTHFPNSVVRQAIQDTKFANLAPLLDGENLYVVGEEANLTDMVKITKRVPHMALLGAYVEDRLLSREGVVQCAALPNMDALRGELVGILGMAAFKTTSMLGSHQTQLSVNLEQLVRQRTDEHSPSTDDNKEGS